MDVNLLIECVKKHVYLYDLSNKEYTNVGLKTWAWESIAEEMDQTSEAVKQKWKTIKDGYKKYKKLLQQAATSGSFKKVSDYRWSRQLRFLDAYQITRTIADRVPQTLSTITNITGPLMPSPKELLMPPPLQAIPSAATNQQEVNSKSSENRFHVGFNPQSPKDKTSEEPFNITKVANHDAIDYLFLSYAQTFKKFPLRQQLMMKIELAKMFSKAEWEASGLESANPLSYVQVHSVMSIDGIDNVDSPIKSSPRSSCSNSDHTYLQDDDVEEHIVP